MIGGLRVALWAEAYKLRRSRTPWLSAAGVALGPLMAGVFVVFLRSPKGSPGLFGGKAQQLDVTADWPGYLRLLTQLDAVGVLLVFGILTAWTFGREFSERTAIDLLALPVLRASIVLAKFAVIAAWSVVLAAFTLIVGFAVGAAVVLPGWSPGLVAGTVADFAVLTVLSVLLMTPIALAASVGRGYLPAVGAVLLAIFFGQSLATVGVGAWFPWAVPALAVGAVDPHLAVGTASYLLVGLVSLAGGYLTVLWWRTADHG